MSGLKGVVRAHWCIAVFMCLSSVQIWGQAVGAIVGTVTDSSGALVPGAKVTAVRVETMLSQSTISTSAGSFVFPDLAVGTYNLTVEAQGFAPQSITGVTLDVSQTRSLDFKLSVGETTQSVGVTAAPPLLNTTDATLAGLVTEQQVASLPLNGRSIQNLVMLQPGMAPDTGSMAYLAPNWVGNGNRGETAVETLDGADATDAEFGAVQFWNFNLDAIAEFKVLQANYSAEFGQGGGTVTEIVSKSGTNRFHGSAFEFVRNSVFDSANYFSNSGVSPFQRNEFGATLGGPILRDRTFFFGEYAGYRQRLGEPTQMLVPTATERTGLISINGYQYQVPLNSVAQQVLSKYPDPNQPSGIYGANTYDFIFKQPTNDDQFSVRIDHKISDKDSIFGRVTMIDNSENETDPVAAVEDPSFSTNTVNDPRNFAISETHIFSPTLINNALIAVNRQVESQVPPNQEYPETATADGTLSNWGPDTYISKYEETYYNASDKVNWNLGRQSFSLGIEYRYGQDNVAGVTASGPNGLFRFDAGTPLTENIPSTDGGPTITTGSGSPSGLVSIMAGDAASYSRSTTMPGFGPAGGGYAPFGLRIWHFAPYIQDDIRFTPKLTVNVGLRYEYNSVPYEIRNRLGGIIDYGPLYGQFVLNPQPLYSPQRLTLAPRTGFAYSATGKMIVRGGVAVFTDLMPTAFPDQAGLDFPLAALSSLSTPTYSLTPLSVSLPAVTSTSGAVMPPNGNTEAIPANTPINLAPIAAVTGAIEGYWPSDRLKNGYTLTSNLTIEQQLPADMALEASYVGNNGVDLYQASYPNAYTGAQPANTPYTNTSPGLGEVVIISNDSVSHYNALQMQVRKTSPTHGVQYQANYTWGKDLTDADSVWAATASGGGVSLNSPTCIRCEYARASYNLTQRFVGNFSYVVPGSWGIFPQAISKGWQALGIYTAQSGFPFTITGQYGTLQYGFDSLNGVGARPFFLRTAARDPQHRAQFFTSDVLNNTGNYWSEPTVTSNISGVGLVQTAPGSLGRNTYTGPAWWNMDFSLIKDTHLSDALTMQFRSEFFNVFNHPTFNTPTGTLGSSFGLSNATESTERQMQFALRFMF